MHGILAQDIGIQGQRVKGPLVGINTLGDLVTKAVNFLVPLAGIILFLVFIWGGYSYMMSQGNPEKVKSAQAKLKTGIIGFVLLITSYLIVNIISRIFFPELNLFK